MFHVFRACGALPVESIDTMFDTHAITRELTAAGIDPTHADAITNAVRQAAEHGDHVTPDQFNAGIAALETRLIKWIVGIVLTAAGIVTAAGVTLGIAILRALASLAGG